jgi:two-component system, NtrC family, response regulator
MKDKILIVDDDEGIRTQLNWALSGEYEVFLAENASQALEIAKKEKPDLVALDITLSPLEEEKSGLDIIEPLLEIDPLVKIIMITGHDEQQNALRAIHLGAYDFYSKPINLEELKMIIKRALHVQKFERQNKELTYRLLESTQEFEDIIGSSPKMKEVFRIVKTISITDATVLVVGESGTGKEMVAKAIHNRSLRKHKPFITINCGAIPETLLESELFGHEKGAFTDAQAQKKGKLEYADEGTVFLDEVGELTLPLQVKLLRFLQDHQIERIGGKNPIGLDVRVIAATNRSLLKEVNSRTFREDLYYRLSVITLDLPPLRERKDDILLLAQSFLNRSCLEYKKPGLSFSAKTLDKVRQYDWPGNVRELENRVKRAVILTQEKKISPSDLGLEYEETVKGTSLQEIKEEAEAERIKEALLHSNWNISKASKELEVSRATLYNLMEKYGIKRE